MQNLSDPADNRSSPGILQLFLPDYFQNMVALSGMDFVAFKSETIQVKERPIRRQRPPASMSTFCSMFSFIDSTRGSDIYFAFRELHRRFRDRTTVLLRLPYSDEFYKPVSELDAGVAAVAEWHVAGCSATAERHPITNLVRLAVVRFDC